MMDSGAQPIVIGKTLAEELRLTAEDWFFVHLPLQHLLATWSGPLQLLATRSGPL